ncbi:transcription factor ETV7-like isoform X2 [Tachypleus tridentatus]|uniref:transcription factor ETV7-like isoform X2 n=1 Tax=Tachypleus tridentatus TaxID=6853 RepID=UPI003FD3452A
MDGSSASDASAAALSAYFSLPISSLSGLRCMPFCAMPVAASGVRQNQRIFSVDDKDPPVDMQSLLPNGLGKAMCLLTKSDFMERAPRAGDIIYNCFHLLLKQCLKNTSQHARYPYISNISTALLREQEANRDSPSVSSNANITSPWPIISSDFQNMGHVIHNSSNSISNLIGEMDNPLTQSPSSGSDSLKESLQSTNPSFGGSKNGTNTDMITVRTPSPRETSSAINKDIIKNNHGEKDRSLDKINVRLLWSFLQELLNDPEQRYHHCIAWKDKFNGVFKIVDPNHLARLWGMQKNHLNMNFDKMSRALRYYYRVKILKKEPGERHCYRFLRPPGELRHCKQRSLLIKDAVNATSAVITPSGTANDAEMTVLDMSIKEECE